jgi:Fe-Mn family superoxide dismutase
MVDRIDRRRLLDVGLSGAAALALASCASAAGAQPGAKAPAAPSLALGAAPAEKPIVPLPWSPASLPGLSEKLLTEHHDKNYAGAVKKLNEVRGRLTSADPDKAAGYWSEYGTLKAAEATARNSALLHELYFENLGGGGPPPAALATALAARFGSLERMEKLVRGAALATNGWVVVAVDRASATIEIVLTEGHAGGAWDAEALLVLDMFEHAYALDYGPAKGPYLDAFFKNVAWSVVARRLQTTLARG